MRSGRSAIMLPGSNGGVMTAGRRGDFDRRFGFDRGFGFGRRGDFDRRFDRGFFFTPRFNHGFFTPRFITPFNNGVFFTPGFRFDPRF